MTEIDEFSGEPARPQTAKQRAVQKLRADRGRLSGAGKNPRRKVPITLAKSAKDFGKGPRS